MKSRDSSWDFFVSYASENRKRLASPLVEALEKRGLKVWYDKKSMRAGETRRKSLESGIEHSTYGVIILSKHYMKKPWTNFEFDLIVDKAVEKRRMIFAVWYRVNLRQVKRFSRYLSTSYALRSELGIEEIADKLVVLRKGPLYQNRKRQTKQFKRAKKGKFRRSR